MPVKLNEGQYFGREMKCVENDLFKWNLTKYEPHTLIEEHYHENNYLSLMAHGYYNEKTGSENNVLETGSIIFRASGYNHSHQLKSNGGTCFNIEFKRNWKQTLDLNFDLPGKTMIYKTGCFPTIYRSLHYFVNNYSADLLFELMLEWLRGVNTQFDVKSSLPWVAKVKHILDNEVGEHHTIESLADRVFVHPVYLAGAFRKKTGYTIGEYQVKAKLEKAVSLLFTTKLPVKDIAFVTGFCDAPHFINSYKLIYGSSPGKLRTVEKKLI
jgi:AraC family transcriptional regulator